MKNHGMPFGSFTVHECETALAHHVLQGVCVSNRHSSLSRSTACMDVAQHVQSVAQPFEGQR